MKRVLLGLVLGVAVGAVVSWSFLQHRGGAHGEKEEASAEAHKSESHVQHGTNGETFLKFTKEAQVAMGLKVEALATAELKPELKAFGRVLDASGLTTSLSEIALATSQLDASSREHERLKGLFGQNQNVSARAVEVAEAAVQRDRLMLEAARTRLATTWGPEIAARKDLDAFARSTLAQKSALVRIDMPAGEKISGPPSGARVALTESPEKLVAVQLIGPALTADPQTQARGFLFSLDSAGFPANAALLAWLTVPGDSEAGVVIPREAIVRHEGEAFVYVQTGDETFERKEIDLEHPHEKGWFTTDIKPNSKLVLTGAQQLLSEEFKGEAEGE